MNGKVSDAKYRCSPIAKVGLEIPLSATFIIPYGKRKYFDRTKSIVELNYDEQFLPESYDLNELKENMNVGEEDLHMEGDEDDHSIDDEDNNDDVICIDKRCMFLQDIRTWFIRTQRLNIPKHVCRIFFMSKQGLETR